MMAGSGSHDLDILSRARRGRIASWPAKPLDFLPLSDAATCEGKTMPDPILPAPIPPPFVALGEAVARVIESLLRKISRG